MREGLWKGMNQITKDCMYKFPMEGSESHVSALFKIRLDGASFHLYPRVSIKPILQGQK